MKNNHCKECTVNLLNTGEDTCVKEICPCHALPEKAEVVIGVDFGYENNTVLPPHPQESKKKEWEELLQNKFTTNRNAHIGIPENEGLPLHKISKTAYKDLEDIIHQAITQAEARKVEEIRAEVAGLESQFSKKNNYNGNDIKTAEQHYGISAENWYEIIRLEEGAKRVIQEVLSIVTRFSK